MHERMSVDIETFSSVDLIKSGVYAYAASPDFEILIIGYSFDDEDEVTVIDMVEHGISKPLDPDDGESVRIHWNTKAGGTVYKEFWDALTNPKIIKTAFNANFERTCFARYTGEDMPPEQWRCTMVRSMELGLPRSLADVGIALGLPEDKLKDPQGKALIRFFSKPCKPTKSNNGRTRNLPEHDPDKWRLYKKYNRQDVVTEKAILDKLERFPIPPEEWRLWCLDQRINDNGVRLDIPMIEKIVEYDAKRQEELKEEAKAITNLENPNSLAQLKEWLADQGVPMKSVAKDTIAEVLAGDCPDNVRRVLEIRGALGKTSTAKYSKMLDAVSPDGRLRGMFQFAGARSRRWTGKIVQPQNLAKNFLPDLDLARELTAAGDFDTLYTLFGETSYVFSELVRTAFIPSPSCRFVVSDFSAIEARCIAWIAGENWRLSAFKEGKDIYCESASRLFGVPVVKHGINGHLRAQGKVAELALGYQGGIGAIKQMDKNSAIPEEDMQNIVNQWRKASPKIVRLWRLCEDKAKLAIKSGKTTSTVCGIKFRHSCGNLFITIPSGGQLTYWDARIKENAKGMEQIHYKGVNQTTKQWGDVETYGGKIVENIVQATARDCLATAMRRVAAKGYNIVLHIHDEMVIDAPVADKNAAETITQIMAEPIPWAEGLPLKGDTYETMFYKKD